MHMYTLLQSAQLNGYIFKADPENRHSFTSLKLGHIKITVSGTLHVA